MATKGLKNKKIGQTTTEPMGRESKLTLFMVNMGKDLQATEVMDNRITMTGRKVRKMTAITTTSTRIEDLTIVEGITTKMQRPSVLITRNMANSTVPMILDTNRPNLNSIDSKIKSSSSAMEGNLHQKYHPNQNLKIR